MPKWNHLEFELNIESIINIISHQILGLYRVNNVDKQRDPLIADSL
jgi:hypothetical protein